MSINSNSAEVASRQPLGALLYQLKKNDLIIEHTLSNIRLKSLTIGVIRYCKTDHIPDINHSVRLPGRTVSSIETKPREPARMPIIATIINYHAFLFLSCLFCFLS